MTNIYTISIIIVLSILLIISLIKSCNPIEKIVIKTDTILKVSPQIVQTKIDSFPLLKYIPRLITKIDTLWRYGKATPFTPEQYCKDNLAFTVSSNPQIFDTGDTVNAKFSYPQMQFMFDYHSKPDTIRTITNTITQTIKDKASRFNVYIGGGANIGLDGSVRIGANVSVGYGIF